MNKLMVIGEDIITSHINELSHEEAIIVAKIKEDPNFFLNMQSGSLLPNRNFILLMVV